MTLRGGLHWDSGDFFFFQSRKKQGFFGDSGDFVFFRARKKTEFF